MDSIKGKSCRSSNEQFAFCPVLAGMLERCEAVGRSGKSLNISDLSTVHNLLTLRALHTSCGAKRTMEVGFSSGGSCLVFTQTHKDLGALPENQHVAIDPFQRSSWIDEAGLVSIERANLRDYLDFREEPSCYALPRLVEEDLKFELIYIDGSHLFEDVFIDFYFAARLLKERGIILFDDSSLAHVQKVLRFIRTNLKSSFSEIDLTPYRPKTDKKLRYWAAHALGKVQLTGFIKVGSASRNFDSAFNNF
jgi:hypothetical protein